MQVGYKARFAIFKSWKKTSKIAMQGRLVDFFRIEKKTSEIFLYTRNARSLTFQKFSANFAHKTNWIFSFYAEPRISLFKPIFVEL